MGLGPDSEARGGNWGSEDQKRASKVLERWLLDPGATSKGPQQRRQVKRLQKAMPRKEVKVTGNIESMQRTALLDWLEKAKEGLEDSIPFSALGK